MQALPHRLPYPLTTQTNHAVSCLARALSIHHHLPYPFNPSTPSLPAIAQDHLVLAPHPAGHIPHGRPAVDLFACRPLRHHPCACLAHSPHTGTRLTTTNPRAYSLNACDALLFTVTLSIYVTSAPTQHSCALSCVDFCEVWRSLAVTRTDYSTVHWDRHCTVSGYCIPGGANAR